MLDVDNYYFWKNDEFLLDETSIRDLERGISKFSTSVLNAFRYTDEVYRADQQSYEFTNCYEQIYTYNVIANGVMDAVEDDIKTKKMLKAEARMSRAYMHFLLAQWFDMPYDDIKSASDLSVPIVTIADTQISNPKRATTKELYEFIENEMLDSYMDLEDRTEHRMRVYKPSGYMMLGKLYFMMNKYDKALDFLREAFDMFSRDPNVSFDDFRKIQSKYNQEEIPVYAMYGIRKAKNRNTETIFCKRSSMMLDFYFEMSNQVFPYLKPEIYDMFGENDLRRNFIMTVNTYDEPMPYGYPIYLASAAGINFGLELPELYLMLAECEARAGNPERSKEVLKGLRTYRMKEGFEDVPEDVQTREQLIRFCFDEWTREYCGTGLRFFHIRRIWNDPLFQNLKPFIHQDHLGTYILEEKHLKLPFAETILTFNPSWRD